MKIVLILAAALVLAGCAPAPHQPSTYGAAAAVQTPAIALEQSRTAL